MSENIDAVYEPDENGRRIGYIKFAKSRFTKYVFLTHSEDLVNSTERNPTDVFVPLNEFKENVNVAPGDKIQFALYEHREGWRGIDAVNLTHSARLLGT